jgi:hypothetical protein
MIEPEALPTLGHLFKSFVMLLSFGVSGKSGYPD